MYLCAAIFIFYVKSIAPFHGFVNKIQNELSKI